MDSSTLIQMGLTAVAEYAKSIYIDEEGTNMRILANMRAIKKGARMTSESLLAFLNSLNLSPTPAISTLNGYLNLKNIKNIPIDVPIAFAFITPFSLYGLLYTNIAASKPKKWIEDKDAIIYKLKQAGFSAPKNTLQDIMNKYKQIATENFKYIIKYNYFSANRADLSKLFIDSGFPFLRSTAFTVNMFYNGDRMPTMTQLSAFCGLYDIPINRFLTEDLEKLIKNTPISTYLIVEKFGAFYPKELLDYIKTTPDYLESKNKEDNKANFLYVAEEPKNYKNSKEIDAIDKVASELAAMRETMQKLLGDK